MTGSERVAQLYYTLDEMQYLIRGVVFVLDEVDADIAAAQTDESRTALRQRRTMVMSLQTSLVETSRMLAFRDD